jgi:serine/threonine protein kinase
MNAEQPFPEIDSSLLAGLNRVAAASASAGADESERLARARLRELASEQAHARYELEEEIGRGGMGIVYRVRDTDLQRAMAMKVVLGRSGEGGSVACNPVMLARFLEEARVTGQLDHPGIVPLHDLGIDARGCAYFTMRLVRGRHLGEVFALALEGAEGWTRERIVEALVKVCEALDYAHAKGVVHRDLKPQNVMTGRFGEVYLMDWGVAKVLGRAQVATTGRGSSTASMSFVRVAQGDSSGGVTIAGSVFGTPAYMAPEQARGATDEVDEHSDVYSFGAILYHLLAGHPPYTPPGTQVSSSTLLRWVIEGPPEPLAAVAAHAPRDLVAVCEKAMAREKADRYADMREIADDLRAWLAGRPVSALPLTLTARAARWCRRYPWVAATLLAVTLGGATGLWRLSALGSDLVRQAAVDDAASKARMLEIVNELYSSSVVSRVDRTHVEVTHDWRDQPGAIPLPATFLTELASNISGEGGGTLVKHYSDEPFRFRGPAHLDEFGREALASLRANPDQPVTRFEELDGRPVLRYAAARRMAASCVDCHNTHPESSKTDWKVGDVRGVLEIVRPLDAVVERSRTNLRGTLLVVASVVIGLTALCAIALVRAAHGEHPR